MRFSRREGRWIGRRHSAPPGLDPFCPNSPGYAERHRQHVTELPNGMVRIDLGEPIGPSPPKPKPAQPPKQPPPPPSPAPPEPLPEQPEEPAEVKEARQRFRLTPAPIR